MALAFASHHTVSYISTCETPAHIWGRRGKTTEKNPKQTQNAIKKPTPKHSVSPFFPAPRSRLTSFTFLSYKVFSNIYNSLLGYLDTLSIRIAPLFLSSPVANIIQVHKLFFVSNFLGGLFFLCWIACEYSYLLVLPRTACVGNSQNC